MKDERCDGVEPLVIRVPQRIAQPEKDERVGQALQRDGTVIRIGLLEHPCLHPGLEHPGEPEPELIEEVAALRIHPHAQAEVLTARLAEVESGHPVM